MLTYYRAWENSCNFTGRSSRREVIYYSLFVGLVYVLLSLVMKDKGIDNLALLWGLGFLINLPGIALTFRRAHDFGESGWPYLILGYIPFINLIIGLYLWCKKGDESVNEFGDAPISGYPTEGEYQPLIEINEG